MYSWRAGIFGLAWVDAGEHTILRKGWRAVEVPGSAIAAKTFLRQVSANPAIAALLRKKLQQ